MILVSKEAILKSFEEYVDKLKLQLPTIQDEETRKDLEDTILIYTYLINSSKEEE